MLPNIAFAIWKIRLINLHYVQCLNISPMKNTGFMVLMEKELWPQWNVPPWFIASVAKLWFYEILFFQGTILMVKDKKRRSFTLKDTMSIKIIFMHNRNYITWARVKLPVLFVEFDMVYIFWLFFLFTVIVSS